jgi:hypothetical protein
MDLYVNSKIFDILKKDIRKFKSKLLDENYELFKELEEDKISNLFLYSIINNNKVMKKVKLKLLNNNISEKSINELFYTTLKFYYKQENGLFSWNEIEEWNIDLEDIKNTTCNYTLI